MNKFTLTLVLLSLALSGCNDGSSEPPVAPTPNPPPTGNGVALVTSLKASDKFGVPTDSFTAGEEITLTLEVNNPSDRTVAFQASQPCDVVVFEAIGNDQVLWQSVSGGACVDVIFEGQILPGETITFDEVWLGTNDSGSILLGGSYRINGDAEWTFENAGDSVLPPEPLSITLL